MSRPLTLHSDLLAPSVQNKRDRYKCHTDKCQRGTRPRHSQIFKHGISKEREAGAETRAHEIVSCECWCCYFGVCVADVVEDWVEEEEGTDGEKCWADDGNDPLGWVSLFFREREEKREKNERKHTWILSLLVHPNQNKHIGMQKAPTKAGCNLISGLIFPLSSNFGSWNLYRYQKNGGITTRDPTKIPKKANPSSPKLKPWISTNTMANDSNQTYRRP